MAKLEPKSDLSGAQMQQVLKRIRALCNPQIDLDIPRIAVIGDRNAGTLSVTEAISGIPLPGVCGRCPVEYRISPSDGPWQCQISIWGEVPGSDCQRYKVEEVLFGDATSSPQAAEARIRRAYASILNPYMEPMLFLNMQDAELNDHLLKSELSYSWNPIHIDVAGPGMDNLAFVVLPRLGGDADAEVARLTDELARSYLQRRCLILVATNISENPKTSKAMKLARQVDPAGSRTICAINRLNSHAPEYTADAKRWDELCLALVEERDRRVPLPLGYYCIRQPPDISHSTEVTHLEVRQIEDAFFKQVLPWAESTCPHRLGTRNLVSALNKTLNDLAYKSLPSIMEDATRKLGECNAQLVALPPHVEEPTSFVLSLVSRICTRVHTLVEGAHGQGTFARGCRSTYGRYRTAIAETAPAYMPASNSSASEPDRPGGWAAQFLALDGEDPPTIPVDRYIYLEDVRAQIAQAVTHELPDTVPYALNVSLIQDFQRDWAGHTDQCLSEMHDLLHDAVTRLVQEVSGPYAQLASALQRAVDDLAQAKVDSTRSRAVRLLVYERTPFTQLDGHLQASKARLLALYKKAYQDTKVCDKQAQGISADPPSKTASVSAAPVAAASPGVPQYMWPAPSFATDSPKCAFGSVPPAVSGAAPSGCPGTAWRTHFDGTPGSGSELGTDRSTTLLMSIVCMEGYAQWSFEEYRLADYLRGFGPATRALPRLTNPSHFLRPTRLENAQDAPSSSQHSTTAGILSPEPCSRSAMRPGTPRVATASPGPTASGPAPDDCSRTHGAELHCGPGTAERPVDNPYPRELEAMAGVRAYFEMAYKRVVDTVPLAIQHELLHAFAGELNGHLVRRLGLGAPGADVRCAAYLAENGDTAVLRERLESARSRLERVRSELSGLGL